MRPAGIPNYIHMNHESELMRKEYRNNKNHIRESFLFERICSNIIYYWLSLTTIMKYISYFSTLLMPPNRKGQKIALCEWEMNLREVLKNRINVRCSTAMKSGGQNNWFTNGWQIGCGIFSNVSNKSFGLELRDLYIQCVFESKMIHLASIKIYSIERERERESMSLEIRVCGMSIERMI